MPVPAQDPVETDAAILAAHPVGLPEKLPGKLKACSGSIPFLI
jgi:hypothetical protein